VATSGEQKHGSLAIQRGTKDGAYEPLYVVNDLSVVAAATRHIPAEFIEGTDDVSSAFVDWAMPLVGSLPVPGRLASHRVTPRTKTTQLS